MRLDAVKLTKEEDWKTSWRLVDHSGAILCVEDERFHSSTLRSYYVDGVEEERRAGENEWDKSGLCKISWRPPSVEC